jgi:hypothetical protein
MTDMVKFVFRCRCSCILTVDDVAGVRGSNILVYRVSTSALRKDGRSRLYQISIHDGGSCTGHDDDIGE